MGYPLGELVINPKAVRIATNGAAEVVLVATPLNGDWHLLPPRGLSVYNADSVSQTVTVTLKRPSAADYILEAVVVTTLSTYVLDQYVLVEEDESVVVSLGGAHTTTALLAHAVYAELGEAGFHRI